MHDSYKRVLPSYTLPSPSPPLTHQTRDQHGCAYGSVYKTSVIAGYVVKGTCLVIAKLLVLQCSTQQAHVLKASPVIIIVRGCWIIELTITL